jgi:Mg2+ and Co2+ transporter CorA
VCVLIKPKREDEARLFDEFARSLKKGNPASEGKARRARRSRDFDRHDNTQGEYTDVANHSEDERFEDEFERRMITKNPYDNISEETELLREVKDISDELNMLKNLAEDQEDVWKQVWKDEHKPDSGFTHEIPSDIKGEIEEMIKEADFVQQAINALLDLKQKQANIVEAKYTRKQSDDTAVQGDTIMVFTVVTILFVSLVCLVNI